MRFTADAYVVLIYVRVCASCSAPNLFDDPEKATVFTSAHKQRLTWNRMVRLGGVNIEDNVHYIDREDSMQILMHHIQHNHHVRGKLVKEVLTAHGAFRPEAAAFLGKDVEKLAAQVISEPFFTIEPTHVLTKREQAAKHAQDESLKMKGQEPVTWEGLTAAVAVLNEWTAKEPGISEQYVGSMISYFPLHCEKELEYLREDWGRFRLICQPWISGKLAEAQGTPCYCQAPMETKHFSMLWIPLDSIRDYYGDHVGIYFAWLQLYTKSMIMPSAFGIITFLAPLANGKVPGTAPDENILVAPYSIYLCIWTATFLSLWTRRENELKFLWGSEEFEEQEETRRQFAGVMEVNPITKKVKVKHVSTARYAGKLSCSYTMSILLICIVITGAFSASMLRFYQAPPLCVDLGIQPGEDGYVLAMTVITDRSCARCESPLLADSELHDDMLLAEYHTQNYTLVEYERAHYGPVFCEEICVPGEVLEGGIELPSSPGCLVNANGTNVWNDGYPPDTSTWVKNRWKFSSAATNTLLIIIFGRIYESIAIGMNNWENHRTKTEYDDNLILKNFVFQFVNNYFVLFYIAYLRQVDLSFISKELGEIDAECKGGTCMPELSVQVGVVFTTKMLIAQVLEAMKPWLVARKATITEALHLSMIQKQLQRTIAEGAQLILPEDIEEMLEIDEPTLKRKEALDEKAAKLERRLYTARETHLHGSTVERESYMVDYENTFDDFNEMAIQYGYLALFSPAYPLAPLLALLNNIVEIRVDATKLCTSMRRPRWESAEDIGSWMTVLSAIGFAAVMVNSTMVAFVGSKHSILGDRGLPDTTSDDAEALLAEEMGGFKARTKNSYLWLYAVGIEHAMLLLRVLVLAIFPDKPEWLDEAHEVLDYTIGNMKDRQTLEQQKEMQDAFLEKLDKYSVAGHENMDHLTTRYIKTHKDPMKKENGTNAVKQDSSNTSVKVNNPLHQAVANPMTSEMSDSENDADTDTDDEGSNYDIVSDQKQSAA